MKLIVLTQTLIVLLKAVNVDSHYNTVSSRSVYRPRTDLSTFLETANNVDPGTFLEIVSNYVDIPYVSDSNIDRRSRSTLVLPPREDHIHTVTPRIITEIENDDDNEMDKDMDEEEPSVVEDAIEILTRNEIVDDETRDKYRADLIFLYPWLAVDFEIKES